jgi:hypothetical protein
MSQPRIDLNTHVCENPEWEYDGQGVPLEKCCPVCRQQKLAKYRPEILRPYTQADVDEPIEPD